MDNSDAAACEGLNSIVNTNGMALSLGQCFSQLAMKYPEADYIVQDARRFSYAQVDRLANQFAGALLARGVRKGCRIALMVGNVPEYLIALQGCFKVGIVAVPLNERATCHELVPHLDNTGAVVLVAISGMLEKARHLVNSPELPDLRLLVVVPGDDASSGNVRGGNAAIGSADATFAAKALPSDCDAKEVPWSEFLAQGVQGGGDIDAVGEVCPDDVAVLQHTGGTTGRAKAAVLTHANLVATGLLMREWIDPAIGASWLRCLVAQPLYHVMGLVNSAMLCLARGGTCVLSASTKPEDVLEAIKCDRPTYFAAVPTLLAKLATAVGNDQAALSPLRLVVVGGSPMPRQLRERLERSFGLRLVQGYGMSEVPVVALEECAPLKDSADGLKPLPGIQVRIVRCDDHVREVALGEEGEVLVKGLSVGKGYWNGVPPCASLSDGWFETGDIARWTDEGSFVISGRSKDLIVSSGFNVYPCEIDEVLLAHPAVLEACTIGVPHQERVEAALSFVVLSKSRTTCDAAELIAYCRKHLTAYKVPENIELVDELPHTSVGKPDRVALRKWAKDHRGVG